MKVLIACEESQAVCKAFREKGHEAYSCDIIECSGGHPEWRIMQDVLPLLNGRCEFKTMDGELHEIKGKWDMILAFPPCTYMSKAGARWMYPKAGEVNQDRLKKAMEAKLFFMEIYNAECERVCVENPTPLKIVGLPKESQVIQPYLYGHPYSKKTCLWIKGLPKLVSTNILNDYKPYCPSNTGAFSKGKGGSLGVAQDAKKELKHFPVLPTQWRNNGDKIEINRRRANNMAITCCHNCEKRHQNCHASCEEYISAKAEHIKEQAEIVKQNAVRYGVYEQRAKGIIKALKRKQANRCKKSSSRGG